MWGRLLIAPFEVSIPKDRQDKDLQWKFDRACILAWIIGSSGESVGGIGALRTLRSRGVNVLRTSSTSFRPFG